MLGVGTLWERSAFWSVLFTFLYLLFEIVYVYVCAVFKGARRGHRIPMELESQAVVNHLLWVLGSKLRSS